MENVFYSSVLATVIDVNSSAYRAKYCCPCACHENVRIILNLCTYQSVADGAQRLSGPFGK